MRYLYRVSQHDNVQHDEPLDDRPAFVRLFFEGGDDVPPENLLDDQGNPQPPPRRRAKGIPEDLKVHAADRFRKREPKDGDEKEKAKNERSAHGEWDQFVIDPWPETDLYRIIAQIVHAIEQWDEHSEFDPAHVLELRTAAFPSLSETTLSVPKAWALLEWCGVGFFDLKRSYGPPLDAAKELAKDVPGFADLVSRFDVALYLWLIGWRDHPDFKRAQPARKVDPPLPPRPDNPCQYSPPIEIVATLQPGTTGDKPKDPPPPPAPPRVATAPAATETELAFQIPTVEQAIGDSEEAVLAAFDLSAPQVLVDTWRSFKRVDGQPAFDDRLIIDLLTGLTDRWRLVAKADRYASAGDAWRVKFATLKPPEFARSEPDRERVGDAVWRNARKTLALIRDLSERFRDMSALDVRHAAIALAKASYDPSIGVDRGTFDAAADRTGLRLLHDDCPFRLAALMSQAEVYMRLFDAMSPSTEDGDGADGFMPPTLDPLSAFYWRTVVMKSTMHTILDMKDTADFHVAAHLRFLGLFRRGGRHRPENGRHEDRLRRLVPDWFLRFAEAALLRFKYWVSDPPGVNIDDKGNVVEMTFWSENHQILFASSEYIAGLWWPAKPFTHARQNGRWHHDRAFDRVEAWLLHRVRFGFSETNSGTYYNQHFPAVFNLADFVVAPAEASTETRERLERIRRLALMVLDLMVFDIVRRTCQGSFVAASGRSYWGTKRTGWSASISDFIEVLTGTVGDVVGWSENAAVCFCTSTYVEDVPECLLALGVDHAIPIADRSRTSIDVGEGLDYGIEHDTSRDLIFWWGCSAYFTHKTYEASQSWSYRWGLRHTPPFTLFEYVDKALYRLAFAVLAHLSPAIFFIDGPFNAMAAVRQSVIKSFASAASVFTRGAGSGPASMDPSDSYVALVNGVMLTPHNLRSIIDILLSVLDFGIALVTSALKEVGALDENDDRVRVARPAIEQAFRDLAISLNAGSVLGRQRIHTWRAADAMLSSLVDDTKGETSAQKEACIACLGMTVSVFTGKRLKRPDEFGWFSTTLRAVEGFGRGTIDLGVNPESAVVAQIPGLPGSPLPQVTGAFSPIAAHAFGESIFGTDGPKYWFGYSSSPLVYQHENVAVAIYHPTAAQQDFAPEETHVHWPWDQFDAVATRSVGKGRWVFGRRDRRFPPRSPCRPESRKRPGERVHWPEGEWRKERIKDGAAPVDAGYVAVYSAQGLKTAPAEVHVWERQWKSFAHRELIADGDDNIFVTVVGDRSTYRSFGEFQQDVLASSLEADLDDLTCSMTMPMPGGAKSGRRGARFEVSWEEGGKVDGTKIDLGTWPRFEHRPSSLGAAGSNAEALVESFRVTSETDPGKGRVDFDDPAWRVEATLHVWIEVEETTPQGTTTRWVPSTYTTSLVHDLTDVAKPGRSVSDPAPPVAIDEAAKQGSRGTSGDLMRSPLGREFRQQHFRAGRRPHASTR
jgi:hypothetical protein